MVGVRLGERTRPHVCQNYLPHTSLNISPKIFVINVFYIYLNTEEIISSLYICTKMFVHYSILVEFVRKWEIQSSDGKHSPRAQSDLMGIYTGHWAPYTSYHILEWTPCTGHWAPCSGQWPAPPNPNWFWQHCDGIWEIKIKSESLICFGSPAIAMHCMLGDK